MSTSPSLGCSKPAIMRSAVVLPHPEGPRRDRNSPALILRSKHEFGERWALEVEGFSEIEDLAHAGSFDDQSHRLGPVAYYEFPHAEGRPEWKAVGGILFGVSDAVSDLTYKFDLEVEF